jgi:hypothetical protein
VTVAKPGRSHDALQQLLEERKRYEQWLATLESKRDSTPEHVYKRVHADYEGRLSTVRDQLTERTSEIRSAVAALKERLKQASEQESARTDELHEAELRATVGEFTPEQWELRKREVEVDLKQFADEKKKISDELNQLLLIVEQTSESEEPAGETASPAASEAAPQPAPTALAAAPEPPPAESPAASPPPPAPVAPDATRVSRKTPARSRATMHTAPPPPVEEENATVSIESLAPADGLPAKVPESPRAPTAAAAPADAESESRSNSHAKRGKTSSFAPAQQDPKRENEKTLKCAECGAMNYPTEWYCESCGGELSAL